MGYWCITFSLNRNQKKQYMLDTKETEVVRLIATTKKFERAPWYMAPELGHDKKPVYYFMNDNSLSEKEKEDFIKALNFTEVSDEDGVLRLHHLMQLRMNDVRDRAIYYYLKNMPKEKGVVGKDKNSANAAKHRFYIENKETEGEVLVEKMAVKFKAIGIANEIIGSQSESNDSVKDALRLVGIPVKGLSTKLCLAALLSEADTQPKRFIDILGDKYREYRIFLIKCIEKGLLFKNKSGSYSYNNRENIVALNDSQMIAYLQDRANEHLVKMWSESLNDNRLIKKITFAADVLNTADKKIISSDMNAKNATAFIENTNDIETLKGFVAGEERAAILQLVNKKIEKLSE